MNRYAVVALILAALLITYLVYQRSEPPAPETVLPTPAQLPEAPLSPAPLAPADLVTVIPELADNVAAPSPAPSGARAMIVSPADGAIVSRTFTIKMALDGMTLTPAGAADPRAGHFHLLIDIAPGNLNAPIRRDAHHLDFGSGVTEAEIELPPGKHTLQILIGDGNHVPHSPPVLSAPIAVTVGSGDGT